MDNQVHNQIVSFIWGIADDCLRCRNTVSALVVPNSMNSYQLLSSSECSPLIDL